MKPIITTSRLHFDDLSYERFEDLCVQVIYNLKQWDTIQHLAEKEKMVEWIFMENFFDGNERKKMDYTNVSATKRLSTKN